MTKFLSPLLLIGLCGAAWGAELSIRSETLEFTLQAEIGHLLRVTDVRRQRELRHGPSFPIFRIWVGDGAITPRCLSDFRLIEHAVLDDGRRLDLRFQHADAGLFVKCSIELAPDGGRGIWGDGLSRWQIAVENRGAERVVEIEFPLLSSLQLGADAKDDVLTRPAHAGQRIPNPMSFTFGADPSPQTRNPETIVYPGGASMMWQDLCDMEGGIYIASYDLTPYRPWNRDGSQGLERLAPLSTGITCQRQAHGLLLSMKKFVPVEAGGKWDSQPFAVGIHGGDWHRAADWYRAWSATWLKPRVRPGQAREHLGFGGGAYYLKDKFCFPFSKGQEFWEKLVAEGVDSQHFVWITPDGTCWPCYYAPHPQLGGADELKRVVADVRRRGGRTTSYVNGLHYIRGYPDGVPKELWPELGLPDHVPDWAAFRSFLWDPDMRRHAVRRCDGTEQAQIRRLGYMLMCPATKGWADYIDYWVVDKYCKEYGFTGMQIDQIGAVQGQYCRNLSTEHGHPGRTGVWAQGFDGLLWRLRERLPEDFFLWNEGCVDILSRHMDRQISSIGSWQRFECPDVFRYTIPDAAVAFAPDEEDPMPDAPGPEDVFLWTFLSGSGFHGDRRIGRRNPDLRQRVFNVRRCTTGLLAYSTYRDDRGIGALPEGVQAKMLLLEPDRSPYHPGAAALINIVDKRTDRGPFHLEIEVGPNRTGLRRAVRFRPLLKGRVETIGLERKGEWLALSIPPAGGEDIVSCIVVSGEPIVIGRILHPATARRGETVQIRMEAGREKDGQFTWTPAPGATLSVGSESFTTSAAGAVDWRAPMDAPIGSYILRAHRTGTNGFLPATDAGEMPVLKLTE